MGNPLYIDRQIHMEIPPHNITSDEFIQIKTYRPI